MEIIHYMIYVCNAKMLNGLLCVIYWNENKCWTLHTLRCSILDPSHWCESICIFSVWLYKSNNIAQLLIKPIFKVCLHSRKNCGIRNRHNRTTCLLFVSGNHTHTIFVEQYHVRFTKPIISVINTGWPKKKTNPKQC